MEPKPSILPWSIQEVVEDQMEGRGEMNCGNLGEGCRRRDFPGDTNNMHCLTSIKFLKKAFSKVIRSWLRKNKYILLMVKQIQYLMYPCNCCKFFNKNLYCCFCFWVLQFYFNPLTPVQAVTSLGPPLLKASLLTKIGIIYTQLLQVEKIFLIIPRSDCSA